MNDTAAENANKILIVDDDKQTRIVLTEVLSHFGYATETAENGTEALEKTRAKKPDLILLDIFMPEMNGIEVCRSTRKDPETRYIPIMVMTGFADGKVKMQCLEAGANDFLAKPIDYAELNARIRNLLQLREFEDIKIKNEMLTDTIRLVEGVKREWEMTLDCINDAVILIDAKQNIARCNKVLTLLTGKPYSSMQDRNWMDVLRESGFTFIEKEPGNLELYHSSGRWFNYNPYSLPAEDVIGPYAAVITLNDITGSKIAEDSIKRKNAELEKAYAELKAAQSQLLQREKMASIGQLAAGVAHEINNPMGFIISNLGTLDKYVSKLGEFVKAQSEAISELTTPPFPPLPRGGEGGVIVRHKLEELGKSLKIDYITEDIAALVKESLDGADRAKKIVQDLKSFSHVDEAEHKMTDINAGIESTVNIVWNELKYKVTLKKGYGDIPMIKCNPGQLNQVFMNMLLNAADAIESQGEIGIKTWDDKDNIYVSISDTGSGIPADKIGRIFEPFYTTKEVGKGTGLGLSIAYDIIKKHDGDIKVESAEGKGTTFTISIPVVLK